MKLSNQQINRAWLYVVTKMILLTKIGENKEKADAAPAWSGVGFFRRVLADLL